MINLKALHMPERIFTLEDTILGINITATLKGRLSNIESNPDKFHIVCSKQRPFTAIFFIFDNFHNGFNSKSQLIST